MLLNWERHQHKGITMKWTAWTTIAALLMYVWVFSNAGKARIKFQVKAPSMDGPTEFLCAQRVHANTLEQIVLFLPLLWMCASFLGDRWAAAGGAVWVLGRVIYALAYYREPSKRAMGFIVSLAANAALMLGAIVGLIM
jgi:glutathione S-transferase